MVLVLSINQCCTYIPLKLRPFRLRDGEFGISPSRPFLTVGYCGCYSYCTHILTVADHCCWMTTSAVEHDSTSQRKKRDEEDVQLREIWDAFVFLLRYRHVCTVGSLKFPVRHQTQFRTASPFTTILLNLPCFANYKPISSITYIYPSLSLILDSRTYLMCFITFWCLPYPHLLNSQHQLPDLTKYRQSDPSTI
jgi:hypothetical protein